MSQTAPVGYPPSWTAYCFACGRQIDPRAEICPHCGVRQRTPPQVGIGERSRAIAALLAILVGGLGVHKFYLGKIAQGIIYLLFCWTLIPAIVAFFEGIWYLTMSDQEFWHRYPVDPRASAGWASAPSTWTPVAPPPAAAWPPARGCATCGSANAADATFCIRCGRPLAPR